MHALTLCLQLYSKFRVWGVRKIYADYLVAINFTDFTATATPLQQPSV